MSRGNAPAARASSHASVLLRQSEHDEGVAAILAIELGGESFHPPSPPRCNRDVLFPVYRIGHGASVNAAAGMELPQELSTSCIECIELAGRFPHEHDTATG